MVVRNLNTTCPPCHSTVPVVLWPLKCNTACCLVCLGAPRFARPAFFRVPWAQCLDRAARRKQKLFCAEVWYAQCYPLFLFESGLPFLRFPNIAAGCVNFRFEGTLFTLVGRECKRNARVGVVYFDAHPYLLQYFFGHGFVFHGSLEFPRGKLAPETPPSCCPKAFSTTSGGKSQDAYRTDPQKGIILHQIRYCWSIGA